MGILRAVPAVTRGAWVVLAFLLVGQGCTGEESFALPPLEDRAPDNRDQEACTAWAQSTCAYDERCSDAIVSVWQDLKTCVAREALACELAADDPNVSFDAAGVRNCQFPTDCTSPRPNCWPPGRTPGGSPCVWGEACQGGLCLGSATLGVCGICLCGAGCPAGQTCNATSAAGTCAPPTPPAKSTCISSGDCPSGRCQAAPGASGECAPFAGPGDPCGEGVGLCGDDSHCDDTGVCRTITTAPYGARCGPPVDGGTFARCGGFAICLGATCVAPAQDGDPCDPSRGVACVWPAQCVAGHCVFPMLADCVP